MSHNAQSNVENLNYEYLVQFREIWQRSEAEACLRFRMSMETGRHLATCTHQELKTIASRARVIFSLAPEEMQRVH